MTSTENYTDHQLLLRLKGGDKAAFTELYNRHWSLIYRDAMRVLRSEEEAEDVVQELFESIWKRRESLDIHTSFAAYLRSSARYIAINKIERNISKYSSVESLPEYIEQAQISQIEATMDAKQLELRINQEVEKLPEKMREVFRLSRKEGLTHRQIAQQLNISEETVKKQVYNALKQIRQGLGGASLALIIAVIYL